MAALDLAENKASTKVLIFLLLVGSTVLVLFDIRAILSIFYSVFALFSSDVMTTTARAESTLYATGLTLILGLAALGFIIFMFEFFMRRTGNPRSLRSILIILAVQVGLIALSLLA